MIEAGDPEHADAIEADRDKDRLPVEADPEDTETGEVHRDKGDDPEPVDRLPLPCSHRRGGRGIEPEGDLPEGAAPLAGAVRLSHVGKSS